MVGLRRLLLASLRSFGDIWNNCPKVMLAFYCCKSLTMLYGCMCAAIEGCTGFFFFMTTHFFFGVGKVGSFSFNVSVIGGATIGATTSSTVVPTGGRFRSSFGFSGSASSLS